MLVDHQASKTRDLLDRARKFVHRRSYWQALASSHPINGVSPGTLADQLGACIQGSASEAAIVPLPGLRFRRGQSFYQGHATGPVAKTLVDAFQMLERGEALPDPSPLLAAGLAFQIAPRTLHSRWDLVVSPHEDDAALSLGGLIHQTAASSAQVLVCNVFTLCCWLGDGFRQSSMPQVSRLRSAEETLSNQVLGSLSLGLDLWDAQVRIDYRRSVDDYPVQEGFVFASDPDLRTLGEQDSIRHSILRIVETLAPTRIFFPLGLGSHLDHRYLRDLGMALHAEIPALGKPCSIYFYEDMPYATYEDSDVQAATSSLGDLGVLAAEVIDVTSSFEAKIQAIAAHRSQFRREENESRLEHYASALATGAGLPDGHLAERIWRLDPR